MRGIPLFTGYPRILTVKDGILYVAAFEVKDDIFRFYAFFARESFRFYAFFVQLTRKFDSLISAN